MSSIELKNCPFCGGEAEFSVKTLNGVLKFNFWEFRICCSECNLTSPKTYKLGAILNEFGDFKIAIDERNEAIEAWNRRTNDE